MLRIADKTFDSHLFTGTGKFASSQLMVEAIRASGSQLVTLAMKRVDLEAIFAAHLAREALGTNWLKLEIHPDARWLLPDPIETLKAAETLVQQGFVVNLLRAATEDEKRKVVESVAFFYGSAVSRNVVQGEKLLPRFALPFLIFRTAQTCVQQFCQAGRCVFCSHLRCSRSFTRSTATHTILVVRVTGTGRDQTTHGSCVCPNLVCGLMVPGLAST